MRYGFLSSILAAADLCLAASVPPRAARTDCKKFEFDLTWETRAPDGFSRPLILINGKSPGPEIHIKEGDCVEVLVNNKMQLGATIHFHGIQQQGTPWSDGVPGVSQREIPRGKSFEYQWTATQYGTYWYHAHARGQIMDGLYGPLIIDPALTNPKPFSMISNDSTVLKQLQKAELNPTPVLVSDWSHMTGEELRDIAVTANIDTICMDSVLINGKGSVNCQSDAFLQSLVPPPLLPLLGNQKLSAKGCLPLRSLAIQTNTTHYFDLVPPSLFDVCTPTNGTIEVIKAKSSEGWISLNFISTASVEELTFSIDEHPMWVYSADGLYIEPQQVDAVLIPHGSRYSVFVKLDKTPGDYTIRVVSSGLNQKIAGYATLSYYSGAYNNSKPSIDYGGSNTTADVRFLDTTALVPFPAEAPARKADTTFKLFLQRVDNAWTWSLNDAGIPFGSPLDLVTPLLWDPKSAVNGNLTISTKNGTWVDLVLISGPGNPSHPIHKHSNKGYIIGAGIGPFNWTDVEEAIAEVPQSFNLKNPLPKDGYYTLPAITGPTWMVVRYQVVNPGAFLLHCHINPHLTGGMAIVILDGTDAFHTIPADYGPGGKYDYGS